MCSVKLRAITTCAFLLWLSPMAIGAHEGEVHETGAAAQQAGIATEPSGWSGRGDVFEVVVKTSRFDPKQPALLTAYVVEVASNKPIVGAKVSASVSIGKDSVRAEFAETTTTIPGAYTAKFLFPGVGNYSALFEVSRGDTDDLVAVDGIRVQTTTTMVAAAIPPWGTGGILYWKLALGAALFVLVVVVAFTTILRQHRAKGRKVEEIDQ